MNKIASYLQEHLLGEVVDNPHVLSHFATDGSILNIKPTVAIYPHSEVDIRKLMRFTWQLAERGKVVPVTVRGAGTDQGGAAIGSGIIVSTTAHMDKILSLDPRKGEIVMQPGAVFGKLQQSLMTHYRFLPFYQPSFEYTTIGGAIANNDAGEKSIKYGSAMQYVDSLRVVLANGEVIDTRRMTKREVNKKMGEATLEGEIYRGIDAILNDYASTIETLNKPISRSSAGYDIYDVRNKDGSIDLTPLFVGSQGTLGIITEATLSTENYTPHFTVLGAFFDDYQKMANAANELKALSPSILEMVDEEILADLSVNGTVAIKQMIGDKKPKCFLLVEFDDAIDRKQKRKATRATKILHTYAYDVRAAMNDDQKDVMLKFRKSVSGLIVKSQTSAKALPFIEDAIVPLDKYATLIEETKKLLQKHGLHKVPMWGHAGDGVLSMMPRIDLSLIGDRQKVFKLMDEYYSLVIGMGGSTSASANDGRLRASYLPAVFGDDAYAMFQKIKHLFDPLGILNAGVKVNVDPKTLPPMLRNEYSMSKLYSHLPRI